MLCEGQVIKFLGMASNGASAEGQSGVPAKTRASLILKKHRTPVTRQTARPIFSLRPLSQCAAATHPSRTEHVHTSAFLLAHTKSWKTETKKTVTQNLLMTPEK